MGLEGGTLAGGLAGRRCAVEFASKVQKTLGQRRRVGAGQIKGIEDQTKSGSDSIFTYVLSASSHQELDTARVSCGGVDRGRG